MRSLWVVLIGLMSSGCWSVITPQASKADMLLAQGKLQEADDAYAMASQAELAQDEWDYIFEQRCKARTQILQDAMKTLRNTQPSTEEVEKWQEYSKRCPSYVEFYAELTDMMIAAAERQFSTEVDPRVAQGDLYGALKAAEPLTRLIPEGGARAKMLEDLRERYAADLAQKSGELETTYPTTKSVLDWMGSWSSLYEGQIDRGPTERFMSVAQANSAAAAIEGDCVPIAIAPLQELGSSTGYEIVGLRVSDCTKTVSVREGIEEYIEYIPKVVTRQVEREIVVPVSVPSTTNYVKCYSSGNCYTTASYTTYSTRYETQRYTETITETIQEPHQRQRPALFATARRKARVDFEVRSSDGAQFVSFEVSVSNDSSPFPTTTDRALVQGFDTDLVVNEAMLSEVEAKIREESLGAAYALRQETIARLWEAQVGTNPNQATEYALMLWVSGDDTAEVISYLDATLPMPISRFPIDEDHRVPRYTWAPSEIKDNYFVFDASNRYWEGVVSTGYPIFSAGIMGAYRSPETFIGQPERGSAQADFFTRLRWTFSSDDHHKGFGLMLGYDTTFSLGTRLGEDYQRLQELPIWVDEENYKELGTTFGMDLAVASMVGYRSRFFGIFAGVRPTYTSFKIGHFFSEGGTVPLTGRLEIRVRERYPVIAELWWGDLNGSTSLSEFGQAGAFLDWPIGPIGWLRLGATQHVLPAEFFGLFETDDVYVPSAKTITGSVGFTLNL